MEGFLRFEEVRPGDPARPGGERQLELADARLAEKFLLDRVVHPTKIPRSYFLDWQALSESRPAGSCRSHPQVSKESGE